MASKKLIWHPLTPDALEDMIIEDAIANPPTKLSKRSVRLAKKTIPAKSRYDWITGQMVHVPAVKPARKKGVKKQVRNNWPVKHLLSTKFVCAGCGNGTRMAAMQRDHRVIRFRPENPSLVIFQIMALKRTGYPYDLIYHILNLTHVPTLLEDEMFAGQQVVFACGCRYHASCFQKRLQRSARCKKHHVNFP